MFPNLPRCVHHFAVYFTISTLSQQLTDCLKNPKGQTPKTAIQFAISGRQGPITRRDDDQDPPEAAPIPA